MNGRVSREPSEYPSKAVRFVFRAYRAQASKLFSDLKADNFLENLSSTEFAEKAAHFLAELNAIHAFR